jgi:hypothetical protein
MGNKKDDWIVQLMGNKKDDWIVQLIGNKKDAFNIKAVLAKFLETIRL